MDMEQKAVEPHKNGVRPFADCAFCAEYWQLWQDSGECGAMRASRPTNAPDEKAVIRWRTENARICRCKRRADMVEYGAL